jgi:hypothetical protein
VRLELQAGLYELATNRISSLEIVDTDVVILVDAVTSSLFEAGSTNGLFRISRTGLTSRPLDVNVSFSGTATWDVDYRVLGVSHTNVSVRIPAGSATVDVHIFPQPDSLVEGAEEVTLQLLQGPYQLGSIHTASLTIEDAPSVSVETIDNAHEIGPFDGVFRVTRTNVLDKELAVFLRFSGEAIPNVDYSVRISGNVFTNEAILIPTNAYFLDVEIAPIPDSLVEGDESVVIHLLPGPYHIEEENSATLQIVDQNTEISVTTLTPIVSEADSNMIFQISRTRPTDTAQTVQLIWSGDATILEDYNPMDFQSIQTIEIPVGAEEVDLIMELENDLTVETNETVVLEINPLYHNLRSPSSATVIIMDDDLKLDFFDWDDGFPFELVWKVPRPYTIDYSTNLTHWELFTNVIGIGTNRLIFHDQAATPDRPRFYRAYTP